MIIIFLVHPLYAFFHLLMVLVLYVYIGHSAPGVFPGKRFTDIGISVYISGFLLDQCRSRESGGGL